MSLRDPDMVRRIPQVAKVLCWPSVAPLLETCPRRELLTAINTVLTAVRQQALAGQLTVMPGEEELSRLISAELERSQAASLARVINATGVVIHTNLGRAVLAEEAVEAVRSVAAGYSTLEYDLATGERGSRQSHVEPLLCELTGAEAALVVNNNAAAVILALSTLAHGREVIVSRGELVEIGGAFRIPEVMAQSGARLVEVGATNRTHPRDYVSAISPDTALLLKVHTSNYAIVGFTAEVNVQGLSVLGVQHGIPVMLDAGSGCLIDLAPHGIAGEPTVRQYLADGADLVCFSGDKLLGGPQAGIIVGKKALIEPMKRHPLLRALRMDKLGLAALEATLRLYRDERQALTRIPTLRMLCPSPEQVARRARGMLRYLRRKVPAIVQFATGCGESGVGGGAFPLLQLPTTLIEVKLTGVAAQDIEAALRRARTPVIGLIRHDRFLLDVRTIQDSELPVLADSLAGLHKITIEAGV